MSGNRASIFDSEDLDVSGFEPKPVTKDQAKRPAPTAAEVKAVSEEARFPSRQPVKAKPEPPAPAKRVGRQYRTGRNVQFNVKVSQETLDAFYRVADAQGWVLGETLARAVAALTRELDAKA